MQKQRARSLLFALLLAGMAPAVAADFLLKPFRATYSAALNGMPVGFDVQVSLARDNSNDWAITLGAGSSMLRYMEASRFRWNDCHATPLNYRYEFRGFGIDRKLWLDFDHARRTASGESRRGPISYTFPPDATDELSLSFAARCRLLQGTGDSAFNVATTTGIKEFRYRLDGRETVKTSLGKVEAMRIQRIREKGDSRRSTIWIAPALDYLMVKMEHVEKLGVRGMIILKKLEGDIPPPAR